MPGGSVVVAVVVVMAVVVAVVVMGWMGSCCDGLRERVVTGDGACQVGQLLWQLLW
jgi:hypothetical protein